MKGKSHKIVVEIPGNLTLSVHCKAYRRFLAVKRQLAYIQRRHINDNNEITEDEELAARIYKLYNVKEVKSKMDRYSFLMRRATYIYKCDEVSEKKILEIEKEDKEIMELIEEDWVIPDMEKDVIEVSDNELNEYIEYQLDYINKFVQPRKKSL